MFQQIQSRPRTLSNSPIIGRSNSWRIRSSNSNDRNEHLNQHLNETREEHRVYVSHIEDKREEQGAKTSQWDEKFQILEHELIAVKEQNRLLITREEERKRRIEERKRKREVQKLQEQEKGKNVFFRLFG